MPALVRAAAADHIDFCQLYAVTDLELLEEILPP
jgi:hypothetical protein